MIRVTAILFSLLLAGGSAVAARPVAGAPEQSNVAAGEAAGDANKVGDPDKLICRREATSGSRLGAKRLCQTAAEWERQRRDDQQSTEKIQSARWKAS